MNVKLLKVDFSIVKFQVKDPNTPLMSPGLVTGKIQAPPQPVSNSFSNTNGYRVENGDLDSSHEKNDYYKSSSSLLRFVPIVNEYLGGPLMTSRNSQIRLKGPLDSVEQCCPTLSPFAICGDKRFKCGDKQLFKYDKYITYLTNYDKSDDRKAFVATIVANVATERIGLDTTAVE
jgi:hypothetical protein